MNSVEANNVAQPWYRNGIVWLIITLLGGVVVASMITLKIAFSNAPQVLELTKIEEGHEMSADSE